MYGAILGDMIGAPYEFDRGNKTKDFPLFGRGTEFTDDSVMTIAVAEALMGLDKDVDEDVVHHAVSKSMRIWGRKYPDAGYGGRFRDWLFTHWKPQPYNSWGNGSAMRVSSVGWLFDTLEETRKLAKLSAEVTHNHPEGIKGAEATASAIFMARNGASKDEIKEYIIREFDYDLSRTCDEIRPGYHHVESCQETVPEAITAFLEGNDFEDVIRTAVSLGGDCDTLTCIASSIAEAFYGVSDEIKAECRKRLPEDMLKVLDQFDERMAASVPTFRDSFLDGNELIEEAIDRYYQDSSKDNLMALLDTIRQRMHADGHFIFPVLVNEEDETQFAVRTIQTKDGKLWNAAFTSQTEYEKGEPSRVLSNFIDTSMKFCLESETEGFIINPWGRSFMLVKELIEMIFEADGGVEYSVPDDPITAELLEDGSFLKRAVEICNRNRTQLNLIKLARILRDSWVWVPCTAVFSDADKEAMDKVVMEAIEKNDPDSLIGQELTSHDEVRFVPDILQNGEEFFFPVFTTAEEMGEYGDGFSKYQAHFLHAANLAKNNEKKVSGIVINAFSEPFVVPKEMFDIIADMNSSAEVQDGD